PQKTGNDVEALPSRTCKLSSFSELLCHSGAVYPAVDDNATARSNLTSNSCSLCWVSSPTFGSNSRHRRNCMTASEFAECRMLRRAAFRQYVNDSRCLRLSS